MSTLLTTLTTPDPPPKGGPRGTVFYDATCRFCTGLAQRWAARLAGKGIAMEPLPDGASQLEMRLVLDGREYGGADAVVRLCREFWLSWPIGWLGRLPCWRFVLRRAYRWFAARRHCMGGACQLPRQAAEGGSGAAIPPPGGAHGVRCG